MTSSKLTNSESSFDLVLDQVLRLVVEEDSQQFIYITGAAGTGKTTLIERVKDECSLKKMVVAPTGVAALNIGGSTINSAFRIGFDTFPANSTFLQLFCLRILMILPNCPIETE